MAEQRAVVLNMNEEQLAFWRKALGLPEGANVSSNDFKAWLYAHSDMPADRPRGGYRPRKAASND